MFKLFQGKKVSTLSLFCLKENTKLKIKQPDESHNYVFYKDAKRNYCFHVTFKFSSYHKIYF